MIQESFDFDIAYEKRAPKPKTAQRKLTQRSTAARQKPADDKTIRELQATIQKLKADNKVAKDLSDALHNGHMRLLQEVSSLKRKNTLLWVIVEEGKGATIPTDMLNRLIRLAHPDRHSNSENSKTATQWLLAQRPR